MQPTTGRSPDDECVRLALREGGEAVGFPALYEEYSRLLRGFLSRAFRGLHPDTVDDVVSDTWLTAIEKIDQFRGEGRLIGWLQSIARHRMINRLQWRSDRSIRDGEVNAGLLASTRERERSGSEPVVDAVIARVDPLPSEEILPSLRRPYADALRDHYIRGKSLKEIARKESRPIGTIKRRLHAGREMAKQQYALEDGEVRPARTAPLARPA